MSAHWCPPFACAGTPEEECPVQIPAPFDYARATTVDDALALLDRHGPESRVIAGGHSLLPMMKLRLARPEWLIDINDVAELRHITEEADRLRVGALTRSWSASSVMCRSSATSWMSISHSGRASRSFIIGSRLCPPAMTRDSG